MPTEVIALITVMVGIVGSAIGALANHLLATNKYSAEVDKLKAEADKARAEAEKARFEITSDKSTPRFNGPLSEEQLNDVVARVAERVQQIKLENRFQPPNTLYRVPELSERFTYLYAARHCIEMKVQKLVLAWGGGWAGHTSADFSIYFDYAQRIISNELSTEIRDFFSLTHFHLHRSIDVSDVDFLEIQYLTANIVTELDAIYDEKLKKNQLRFA